MVTKLLHGTEQSYDVRAIVTFFDGRAQLSADLKKYKIVEIGIKAIDKWRIRGNIPAARRQDLQTLARMKGKKFDLASFTRTLKPVAAKRAG